VLAEEFGVMEDRYRNNQEEDLTDFCANQMLRGKGTSGPARSGTSLLGKEEIQEVE
jgi:hypothetical protein